MRPIFKTAIHLLCLTCLTAFLKSGSAYEVGSAFSYPCHERLTRRSFDALIASEETSFERDKIPLPLDNTYSAVLAAMGKRVGASYDDEVDRFIAFSLILGSRFTDIGHNSVFDANSMHAIHSHPGKQSAHCLRTSSDDWAVGEQRALRRCFDLIRAGLERALTEYRRPREEQLVKTRIYLDFYGHTEVDVWSPAFELGKTLHTVQDSFSHTVRSDDLRTILHVLNALEVAPDNVPQRDGLIHSLEMDECDDGAASIAEVAVDAGADFLHQASKALQKDDPGEFEPFFDAWMSFESGCGVENDFCGSKWGQLARTDPSTNILNCSANPSAAPARREAGSSLELLVFSARLLFL